MKAIGYAGQYFLLTKNVKSQHQLFKEDMVGRCNYTRDLKLVGFYILGTRSDVLILS